MINLDTAVVLTSNFFFSIVMVKINKTGITSMGIFVL